jgi:hypothetical protein
VAKRFLGWDARPARGHSDLSGSNFFRHKIQISGLGLGAPAKDALIAVLNDPCGWQKFLFILRFRCSGQ